MALSSDAVDPVLQSAHALLDAFRRRRLSPVEVTAAVLDRIARVDPVLKTYVHIDAEGALAAAREAERRWRDGGRRARLLEGIPISVKDNFLVRGMRTGRGSVVFATAEALEDAPVIARLREAGAVLIGKTTLPELAWKGTTDGPATGITRNPWNLAYTPGGSSGGAAAGVAAGLAVSAIGTDGGGSVRIPASYCGVFGIKPTQGVIGVYPPTYLGSLSHIGPLTRTVMDAALLLDALAQPDSRNCFGVPKHTESFLAGLDAGVQGHRIGKITLPTTVGVDDEIAALTERAADTYRRLGAVVETVEYPFEGALEIYWPLYGAAFAMFGRGLSEAQRVALDPGLNELIDLAAGLDLAAVMTASLRREEFSIRMAQLHERYDLLLLPTMPTTAFAVEADGPRPTTLKPTWLSWNPFTYPFNLTQQPAASLPCGLTSAGLPVGLQIVGPRFADATVLQACRAFEREQPIVLPSIDSLHSQLPAR